MESQPSSVRGADDAQRRVLRESSEQELEVFRSEGNVRIKIADDVELQRSDTLESRVEGVHLPANALLANRAPNDLDPRIAPCVVAAVSAVRSVRPIVNDHPFQRKGVCATMHSTMRAIPVSSLRAGVIRTYFTDAFRHMVAVGFCRTQSIVCRSPSKRSDELTRRS